MSIFFSIISVIFRFFFYLTHKEVGHHIYQMTKTLKLKMRPDTTDSHAVGEIIYLKEYTRRVDVLPNDIVIDIGAHLGYFSAYAAEKANCGKVYAYEADPENYKLLVINKEINNLGNLYAFHRAVAANGTRRKLYLSPSTGEHSLYKTSLSKHIMVPAISLEQILKDNKLENVDFLKIDVEGAEYEIILNTRKSTLKKIKKIILEYHDGVVVGYNHQQLIEYLTRNNFIVTKDTLPLAGSFMKIGILTAIQE